MPGPKSRFAKMWDGLNRVGSLLRLTNPCRHARLFSTATRDNPGDIGDIAIGCSCSPSEHAGLLYRRDGAVRVLHLASHRTLVDEPATLTTTFVWVVPSLRPKQLPQIAAFCALAADAKPLLDYGFAYHEASLFSVMDATFVTAAGTTGLTCSTFVVAILRSCGVPLLAIKTWPQNDAIAVQTRTVYDMAERRNADFPEEASRLRREIGSARFSPSQVAGACMHDRRPVTHRLSVAASHVVMVAVNRLNQWLRHGRLVECPAPRPPPRLKRRPEQRHPPLVHLLDPSGPFGPGGFQISR